MLLVSKNIYAEEEQYDGSKIIELEPITVTASRIERRISEVPSSISIISEKDIQSSNAKSIPDLLKSVEGVYTYDYSGVGSVGVINMRGFYGGMSSHQLVLVDGIPQNKGKDKLVDWDLVSLDNVESVEVVRGPASALYGDNAMSGSIWKLSSPTSCLLVCSPSAVTLYSPAGISGTRKLASHSPLESALMSVTTAWPSNNIRTPFS